MRDMYEMLVHSLINLIIRQDVCFEIWFLRNISHCNKKMFMISKSIAMNSFQRISRSYTEGFFVDVRESLHSCDTVL